MKINEYILHSRKTFGISNAERMKKEEKKPLRDNWLWGGVWERAL